MTKVTLNLMILNTLESIKIFFILYYKVKEVDVPYHTEAKKKNKHEIQQRWQPWKGKNFDFRKLCFVVLL